MKMAYKKLGDVCEILDSKRIPITASERKSGQYPYYGANGVQDYVSDFIFDDELVLLAEDGGNFGSKDRPIAYRVSGKCWVNNHAHVLKPLPDIDVDYLCYALMFYDTTGLINGATRQKLTQSAMRQMQIPIRSLDEQKAIVQKISTATGLITLRKTQLQKLDQLASSRFIEMFGDPVTNPRKWNIKKISDFATVKIGPFGSALHADDYITQGHPVINPSHIVDGTVVPDNLLTISESKYCELSAYHLRPGDVVIGRRGEIGRAAVITDSGLLCGTGSMFVRISDSCRPDFLQKIISYPTFKAVLEDKAVGVTMKNLNAGMLETSCIPLPPLELQNEFAAFIEQLDKSVIRDTSDLPVISLDSLPSSDYLLKDNDIVFVRSNGNKALVGRCVAVYPGNTPTVFSGFCIRFRQASSTVKTAYLLAVLRTSSVRKLMAGRGANIQNLNQQILASLRIPLPPLELQNEFAAFVEQLDKSKVICNKIHKMVEFSQFRV